MTKPSGPQQQLYQQLLTCMKGDWHSLAVVPASPGLSAEHIAAAMVEVSTLVRGQPAKLFTTEGLEVSAVSRVIVDVMQHLGHQGLAIVTVDSVIGAQTGIPVIMAADAALLVVELGVTSTADARRTVEIVGEKKFLGAVTLERP